jgi:SAM-dependent methyltransferase
MDRDGRSISSETYTLDYFLTECEGHAEFLESGGTGISRRLKVAMDAAALEPGMTVLDIGSGRGEVLFHCTQAGATAYGLDFSPAALELASVALNSQPSPVRQKVHLVAGDAKALPFANNFFDRVLMFDIVEHLYPWELERTFQDVLRVLKPDGRFVIHTMPNIWYYRFGYPLYRVVQQLRGRKLPADPRQRWQFVPSVHVNEQSPLSLRKTLAACGFAARIWLEDYRSYDDQPTAVRAVFKLLTGWPGLRLVFCDDIFAIASPAVQDLS